MASVSDDEQLIASVGQDTAIAIWTIKGQQLLNMTNGHNNLINCLDFKRGKGNLLATGSEDRITKLWLTNPDSILAVMSTSNYQLPELAIGIE